jgi:hypothetical protein
MVSGRRASLRECERAVNCIDWALSHLYKMLEFGFKDRTDYKEMIDSIATTLIFAQDCINKFKDNI